jgi:hypothetical protein
MQVNLSATFPTRILAAFCSVARVESPTPRLAMVLEWRHAFMGQMTWIVSEAKDK